jgi:hypothetical protein
VIAAASERTRAAGSARIVGSHRAGSPIPEPEDVAAHGVADLVEMRSLVRARIVSERLAKKRGRRPRSPLSRFFALFVTHESELAFVGGRKYIRGEDGHWGEAARHSDWRELEDPLWWLDVFSDCALNVASVGDAYHFDLDLRRATGSARGLTVRGEPGSLTTVPARVWLDREGRATRFSYTRSGESDIWFITELSEFGVQLPDAGWPGA